MEHVLPDATRIATVLTLLAEGYADRMVLSHDAAFFSRVTPPSWRCSRTALEHGEPVPWILPALLEGGATREQVRQLMVVNPARLLLPARPGE